MPRSARRRRQPSSQPRARACGDGRRERARPEPDEITIGDVTCRRRCEDLCDEARQHLATLENDCRCCSSIRARAVGGNDPRRATRCAASTGPEAFRWSPRRRSRSSRRCSRCGARRAAAEQRAAGAGARGRGARASSSIASRRARRSRRRPDEAQDIQAELGRAAPGVRGEPRADAEAAPSAGGTRRARRSAGTRPAPLIAVPASGSAPAQPMRTRVGHRRSDPDRCRSVMSSRRSRHRDRESGVPTLAATSTSCSRCRSRTRSPTIRDDVDRAGPADLPRRGGRTVPAGRRGIARVAAQSGTTASAAPSCAARCTRSRAARGWRARCAWASSRTSWNPTWLEGDAPRRATPELFDALDDDLDRIAFVLDRLREGETNTPLPWVARGGGRRRRRADAGAARCGCRAGSVARLAAAGDGSGSRRRNAAVAAAHPPVAPRRAKPRRAAEAETGAARAAARPRRRHRPSGQRGGRSRHRPRPRRRRAALAQGEPARTDHQRDPPARADARDRNPGANRRSSRGCR